MKKTIYVVNWEILRSGKVREFTTFDYGEYREMIHTIMESNKYELIEFYAMELEK